MFKKGFSMIEALAVSSIISVSILGFMQYRQIEMVDNAIEEFEYDLNKVMTGFEKKIMFGEFSDFEYWIDRSHFNDINKHLLINLTDRDKDCHKDATLNFEGTSYILCAAPLRMKVFDVRTEGSVHFYDDGEFRYYESRFKSRDITDLSKLNKLEKSIKRVMKESEFYSNIFYAINDKDVRYSECVAHPDKCNLVFNFGVDIDYLNPIDLEDEDFNIEESYDENNTKENLKRALKEKGIKVSKQEFKRIENEVEKIKNNPKLRKEMEEQLKRYCSQYDEDDYYFMSLYDKNNECYLAYGK